MKHQAIILFALVLALCLAGCHSRAKVTQIAPVDSLAWGDNPRGNLTLVNSMIGADGELYVSDYSDSIFVYNLTSGQWVRSLGGNGQGPGKFQMPQDLILLSNGNLLVADMMNMRLQEITPRGEFVQSHNVQIPYAVRRDGDDIYYGTYMSANDSGIYKLLPDGTSEQVFNMRQWMNKNDADACWTFNIAHDFFVVSLINDVPPLLVSMNGEVQSYRLTKPVETSNPCFWGQVKAFRKGFLMPFMYFAKYPIDEDNRQDGDIRSMLVYYGMDGSILHTYEIEPKYGTVHPFGWVLDGERALLADMHSGVVYAYDLK